MKKHLAWAVAVILASGCATKPEKIEAAYVSPVKYQSYSCKQLAAEADRVNARAADLTGVQRKKARNDAVATGIAIVVFWPALFLIDGDDEKTAELGRLKGDATALQVAAVKKGCAVSRS